MGHKHSDLHFHNHNDTSNIKVAFFLNLLFTIIELVGGIMTNSMAILSDALHDLGDSLSIGIAWYLEGISNRKKTNRFSYGYKRFSLIGALINAIVLAVGSVIIIIHTIPRLFNPILPDVEGMFFLALLGVIVNGIAVFRLKRGESINEEVLSLHLLEDVLGWIVVLIGSTVMLFYDLPIIDPILSLCIAVFIIYNVGKNLNKVAQVLLQGVPANIDLLSIQNYFASIPEVNDYHDLHFWSLDGRYHILTVHLVMDGLYSMEELGELKKRIRRDLLDYEVNHVTVEFESEGEECIFINDDVI